jgi:hypothetical protein
VAELAELSIDWGESYRLWRVEKDKGARKTLHAVLMNWVALLIGRRNRASVRIVQAKLEQRKVIERGSLGELAAGDHQQRLHDQRIDRDRTYQPSPERSRS